MRVNQLGSNQINSAFYPPWHNIHSTECQVRLIKWRQSHCHNVGDLVIGKYSYLFITRVTCNVTYKHDLRQILN